MVDFSLGDVGSLFTSLREALVGEKITDPNLKLELLKELQNAEAKMMQSKASVIVAEASKEATKRLFGEIDGLKRNQSRLV